MLNALMRSATFRPLVGSSREMSSNMSIAASPHRGLLWLEIARRHLEARNAERAPALHLLIAVVQRKQHIILLLNALVIQFRLDLRVSAVFAIRAQVRRVLPASVVAPP